jgi:putative colanic acid biosynthesis acetyltransferase WcaF
MTSLGSKTQVDLSLYHTKGFSSGAGKLKTGAWYFVNIIFFKSSLFPFYGFKSWLLRLFGASIGRSVVIKPCVNIKYPWRLSVGDYTWIGENAWIDNLGDVKIGKNVCISQGAMLLTGNHNFSNKEFDLMVKGIVIEDGVWIGAKSLVAPGITCETHSVLSVMSVASENLKAYTIYRGNPAIAMKERIIGG